MILDNPQQYWTRVNAADWFVDESGIIFNQDGSITLPQNAYLYLYDGIYLKNMLLRIIGDAYDGLKLLIDAGDSGERIIDFYNIEKNSVLYSGDRSIYHIVSLNGDVKINYIDYVSLDEVPTTVESGWKRYYMSDINDVKQVFQETYEYRSERNDFPDEYYAPKYPIEYAITTSNEEIYATFLQLQTFQEIHFDENYYTVSTTKHKAFFKDSNTIYKVVGRTCQKAEFDPMSSPIYPDLETYNVNINSIPYYNEYSFDASGNQLFGTQEKTLALLCFSDSDEKQLFLDTNYPYFPPIYDEVSNIRGSTFSSMDIYYVDVYVGFSENKTIDLDFDIDFGLTYPADTINIKYTDIKSNGVSILDKNPIVKYWTNNSSDIKVFDKNGENFSGATTLYFQIECDGYETSDVIHKELRMIHIDGYNGDYTGGGLANYAYHNNDNYKKSEARILIPLTNTSFISYKK